MVKKEKDANKERPLKITAVGDGMVGKTCLLYTHTQGRFPTEYVPTVFDNFATKTRVDGVDYETTLWDTAGQEDYERLRPLSYTNTDCFILCFSVGTRASYDNILSKWYPELKQYCPNVPIILIATKIDLREGSEGMLTPADGKRMKKKIKACKYMECSALKMEGLSEIFVEAVRSCFKQPRHKRRIVCPLM